MVSFFDCRWVFLRENNPSKLTIYKFSQPICTKEKIFVRSSQILSFMPQSMNQLWSFAASWHLLVRSLAFICCFGIFGTFGAFHCFPVSCLRLISTFPSLKSSIRRKKSQWFSFPWHKRSVNSSGQLSWSYPSWGFFPMWRFIRSKQILWNLAALASMKRRNLLQVLARSWESELFYRDMVGSID